MKKQKNTYFWTSYSDLMTSLFFIMLVLFALTTIMLKKKNDATERELENIRKVEASTEDLRGEYFEYRKEYEKFILKVNCNFPIAQYTLTSVSSETRRKLAAAGKQIEDFFKKHSANQYLLIIEGQASYDNDKLTWSNYELSFKRAAALAVFWQATCKLDFGSKCELQIAGSGDGRFNPNSMREANEVSNQRFLIYIIPKNILNKQQDIE